MQWKEKELVWTKISLDKYSSVYPTYLSKKFGYFGIKVCPLKFIFLSKPQPNHNSTIT